MKKVRVALYGNLNRVAILDADATEGATIGKDLKGPDGRVLDMRGLAAALALVIAAPGAGSETVIWRTIQEIPPNVIEVGELASSGIVVRQATGNWLTRSLAVADASRLTVVNADGDAGNPTLDLAAVVNSGAGALRAITVDAYGRVTGSVARAITGTAGRIAVTNGDAVAGNPTLDLATVANSGLGTLQATTVDAYGRVTGTRALQAGDVPDVALSANVALLNRNPQTFTGGNVFTGSLAAGSVTVELSNVLPRLAFNETDAAVDNRLWYVDANVEQFAIGVVNDARTVVTDALRIDRTGTVVDSVALLATAITLNGVNVTDYARLSQPNTFAGIVTFSQSIVLPDGSIPFADLANGSACSVLGRSVNSAGVQASIAAAANDRLLSRVGDVLAFTQLTAGMFGAAVIPPAALPAGVAFLANVQTFTAANTFSNTTTFSSSDTIFESTAGVIFRMRDTDAAVNMKRWRVRTLDGTWLIASEDDTGAQVEAPLVITKLAANGTIASIVLTADAQTYAGTLRFSSYGVGTLQTDASGNVTANVITLPGSSVPTTVQGDILYASAANTLTALTKDANATRYLSNTGASNNPAWAQINLANGVTGLLPVGNLPAGIAFLANSQTFTGVNRYGPNALQSTALLGARGNASPNAFEFGHQNAAGYVNTLGWEFSSGRGFLAFHAEAGTTTNTYRTRGNPGVVLRGGASAGSFSIGRLTAVNADDQVPTTDFAINSAGLVTISNGLTVTGVVTLPAGSIAPAALPPNIAYTNVQNTWTAAGANMTFMPSSGDNIYQSWHTAPASPRTGYFGAITGSMYLAAEGAAPLLLSAAAYVQVTTPTFAVNAVLQAAANAAHSIASGTLGNVLILGSNHANGPYVTLSRSGSPFGYIGNGGQMGTGFTLDSFALVTSGLKRLEFGIGSTRYAYIETTGTFVCNSISEALRLVHDAAFISFYNSANNQRRGYLQWTTGGPAYVVSEASGQPLYIAANAGNIYFSVNNLTTSHFIISSNGRQVSNVVDPAAHYHEYQSNGVTIGYIGDALGTIGASSGWFSMRGITGLRFYTAGQMIFGAASYDFGSGAAQTASLSASEVGYKGVPRQANSSPFTIGATYNGWMIHWTGAGGPITVANNFDGFICAVLNNGSGPVTLAQGSGTSMYLLNSAWATAGNRTVPVGACAVIYQFTTNVFVGGAGVT